jgi:hypothetical protein
MQGVFQVFIGLNLAAGKLPLERHGLIFGALADQNPVFPNYQRGYDLFHSVASLQTA